MIDRQAGFSAAFFRITTLDAVQTRKEPSPREGIFLSTIFSFHVASVHGLSFCFSVAFSDNL
jgi:hypothetical protein